MVNMAEKLKDAPRIGEYASEPGSYRPVVRLSNPILKPGEKLYGHLFISGYGNIETAKFLMFPSPGVFEHQVWRSGPKFQGENLYFGGKEDSVNGFEGICLTFNGGIKPPSWKRPTMFMDSNDPGLDAVPQLATEKVLQHAPVEFDLQIRKSTPPGQYNLTFVFTYYNGVEWRSETQSVSFIIQNILQRNEVLIAYLATVAALVGIAAGIAEILEKTGELITKLTGLFVFD